MIAWLGGAGAIVAVLWVFGADELWRRPFWTDEVILSLLLSEPSLSAMLTTIRSGGDWAPPLIHLVLWPFVKLNGAATPTLLRSFALVSVTLAQVFVYLTMRRHVRASAALCGVLAVTANSLVAAHTFEARFYGPWLLCAAAFAWAIGVDASADRSRRRDAAIAVTSVLLCSVHWFGVFTLSLMLGGALLALGARGPAIRRLAPAATGIVVLALISPIALSQRASAKGMMWVADLNWAQISAVANRYWFTVSGMIALALVVAALWFSRRDAKPVLQLGRELFRADTSALLACALMPVALIVLSVVLSPSMIDRYAIVTALVWAPIAAIAAERAGVWVRVVAIAALAWFSTMAMGRVLFSGGDFAAQTAMLAQANREGAARQLPVVFVRLHAIFPVAGPERTTTSARMLVLSDTAINALYPQSQLEWLRHSLQVERNIAAFHERLFGIPRVVTQAQLDTTRRFAVVAADVSLPGGYKQIDRWAATLFPRHRVTRVTDYLAVLER
jgi:hypothetical protein